MESGRPKSSKKVLQEVSKIKYTNVNGLWSKRLEMEELLEREKPDMMILSETKWKSEWGNPDIGKGKYDFGIKNGKGKGGGGGVMILTGKDIRVQKVEITEKKTEIVKVVVKTDQEGDRTYIGVYVPPRTNAWERREYEDFFFIRKEPAKGINKK